jgi:uncharacterized protein YjbI with pentapeptide repeats
LRGAKFQNVDIQNVSFQKVDFQNVDFPNVNFQNVNFQNANFQNVDFQKLVPLLILKVKEEEWPTQFVLFLLKATSLHMYYTLAGLGLTTHISSIFGGGRR